MSATHGADTVISLISSGSIIYPTKSKAEEAIAKFGYDMLCKINGGKTKIYYRDEQGRLTLMERTAKP